MIYGYRDRQGNHPSSGGDSLIRETTKVTGGVLSFGRSPYEEDNVGFRCHICSRPLISGQSDHQPIVAKEPENRPVRGGPPNDW